VIFDSIEKIADAVLFEGYILYPYRPSAIKNRQRWNFGTLYPRSHVEALGLQESCAFRAECLIEANPESVIDVRVRFLQLASPGERRSEETMTSWSEGSVRSRTMEGIPLHRLMRGFEAIFDFAQSAEQDQQTVPPGLAEPQTRGRLTVAAAQIRDGLYRLSATFANESASPVFEHEDRARALAYAFTSAHLLLHIEQGSFVSLLEPQSGLEPEAKQCTNQGVFPVLVGETGSRDSVLCSPIILYDYPRIAPESAGDFFDGCEMDEMLALRVLTLTDEEKAEIRSGDIHAHKILSRTENLPVDHLLKLHGAVRDLIPARQPNPGDLDGGVQPWNPFEERPSPGSIRVFGVEVVTGDRVRLWPKKGADIIDMAMEGKVAIVEAIEQDLEDNIQLAVVLEDDPGRDMGMLRQPGHRFFFHPDEIEPLTPASPREIS